MAPAITTKENNMFAQPTGGSGFYKPRDAEGHLILVLRSHGIDKHFDEKKGAEIDRATVDLVDLDTGEHLERAWLTHNGLVNKLPAGGGMLLGRIGQVQARAGMAFSFMPYEEGVDDIRAKDWLTANPQPTAAPARTGPVGTAAGAAPTSGPFPQRPAPAGNQAGWQQARAQGWKAPQPQAAAAQPQLVWDGTAEPPF